MHLHGESFLPSATQRDITSHPSENVIDKIDYPKIDFLTFSILRPTSLITPFVKDFVNKHIGVIIGTYQQYLRRKPKG